MRHEYRIVLIILTIKSRTSVSFELQQDNPYFIKSTTVREFLTTGKLNMVYIQCILSFSSYNNGLLKSHVAIQTNEKLSHFKVLQFDSKILLTNQPPP